MDKKFQVTHLLPSLMCIYVYITYNIIIIYVTLYVCVDIKYIHCVRISVYSTGIV